MERITFRNTSQRVVGAILEHVLPYKGNIGILINVFFGGGCGGQEAQGLCSRAEGFGGLVRLGLCGLNILGLSWVLQLKLVRFMSCQCRVSDSGLKRGSDGFLFRLNTAAPWTEVPRFWGWDVPPILRAVSLSIRGKIP